ncbi:uncharacterized protein LOC128546237 isoform X2 [Mercenaria mercenaria]|uniref:uncharacterized protein LOC128546237 isoform X2 n=1 Tax=Mercenaria mercenaria TaxID=6596 RepID=UPI00234ED147|nr:uncharacterized protein LOC128546237 isoform X2 [Mercenaria mercenaria]
MYGVEGIVIEKGYRICKDMTAKHLLQDSMQQPSDRKMYLSCKGISWLGNRIKKRKMVPGKTSYSRYKMLRTRMSVIHGNIRVQQVLGTVIQHEGETAQVSYTASPSGKPGQLKPVTAGFGDHLMKPVVVLLQLGRVSLHFAGTLLQIAVSARNHSHSKYRTNTIRQASKMILRSGVLTFCSRF